MTLNNSALNNSMVLDTEPRRELTKGFKKSTHRLIPPEETLARISCVLPVMGITRVANVTGLDSIGIPVVMVCRPNSRSVSVSQGKGFNLAAAKVSGIMESIESFHAERIEQPLRLCGYEDLHYKDRVVDVEALPRLTDSQFSPHAKLLWTEGRDLLSDEPIWVPYEMVHLDYTLPLPSGHGCFVASSNGLASGNHLIEAINHGISEVVERDATTLWQLQDAEAQRETFIDLDTVDDPHCRMLLDKYRDAGVLVGVWEQTSDVGIPTFLCRILQKDPPPASTIRPASGMGCHPSRRIALLRALTEAAQSRLTFIAGARDDMPRDEYAHFLDRKTYDTWRDSMGAPARPRDFADGPNFEGETLDEDLDWLLGRLEAVGIREVAAVDLTKPEYGIPVVRVVIPGLEGVNCSTKHRLGTRAKALMREMV